MDSWAPTRALLLVYFVLVFLFVKSVKPSPTTVSNSVGLGWGWGICVLTSSLEILVNVFHWPFLRSWPSGSCQTDVWYLISVCIHFSMATRTGIISSNGSVWALFMLNKTFILFTKVLILKNWGFSDEYIVSCRVRKSGWSEPNSKRKIIWETAQKEKIHIFGYL